MPTAARHHDLARIALAAVAAAAALAAWAPRAAAFFDQLVPSSRRVALGAFVSVVDDASATVVNPAALVQAGAYSLTSTYIKPYGVDDLDEGFVAGSYRTGIGTVGASWHYTGQRGVSNENLFTLAFARDLIRTSEDASLSLGASLDVARVSVADVFDASQTLVTGGASVYMRPFPVIGVAYAIRNLNQPEFDLIEGGGKTPLERVQSWGFSYEWHERVTFSYERREQTRKDWHSFVGVEVEMNRHLALRSGVSGGAASGGIGVGWRGAVFDAGFRSHEILGTSYVVSVGYTPPAPENPYAQTP